MRRQVPLRASHFNYSPASGIDENATTHAPYNETLEIKKVLRVL